MYFLTFNYHCTIYQLGFSSSLSPSYTERSTPCWQGPVDHRQGLSAAIGHRPPLSLPSLYGTSFGFVRCLGYLFGLYLPLLPTISSENCRKRAVLIPVLTRTSILTMVSMIKGSPTVHLQLCTFDNLITSAF